MNDENDIKIEQDETLDDSVLAEESAQETIKNIKDKLKKALKKNKNISILGKRIRLSF